MMFEVATLILVVSLQPAPTLLLSIQQCSIFGDPRSTFGDPRSTFGDPRSSYYDRNTFASLHCEHDVPDFSSFNPLTLETVRELLVDHCPFASITRQRLKNVRNLKVLEIKCAEIEVKGFAFDDLTQLVQLSITKSSAASFSPQVFCYHNSLRKLTLSGNMLSSDAAFGLGYCSGGSFQSDSCGERILTFDGGDNRLTSIRKDGFLCNLKSLYSLNLERNAIVTIEKEAFSRVKRLYKLLLEGNLIAVLPVDTFEYATELTTIDLGNNRLSSLPENVFEPMKKLQNVILSGNKFATLSCEMFPSNNTFDYLDLSNNQFKNNGNVFGNISFGKLDLSGNQLETIDSSTIDGIRSTYSLNFSRNAIKTIEVDIFDRFNRLTSVDLSYNQLKKFPKFRARRNIYKLLIDHNEIEELLLDASGSDFPEGIDTLSLSHNKLTSIGPNAFAPFHRVVNLHLDENNIETIDNSAFHGLSGLSLLNLHGNKISFQNNAISLNGGPSLATMFTSLSDLGHLYLSDNQISFVLHDQFRLPELRLLNLRSNLLTTLPHLQLPQRSRIWLEDNPFLCDCGLTWLNRVGVGMSTSFDPQRMTCHVTFDPEYAKISLSMLVYEFRGDSLCANFEDRSSSLTLSNCSSWICRQRQLCPDNCICYHNFHWTIVKMVCSNSSAVVQIPKKIPSATDVAIFYNLSITSIDADTLGSYCNVTYLAIRHTPLNHVHENSFKCMTIVETIDLNHNELTNLNHPIFKGLFNLRHIDLSYNRLKSIGLNVFDDLKSLQSLNISNNRLINFPAWSINSLATVSSMALGGNPWSCDCTFLIPFSKFLISHGRSITNVSQLYCKHQPLSDEVILLHAFNVTHCAHNNSINNVNCMENNKNVIIMDNNSNVASIVFGCLFFSMLIVFGVFLFAFRVEVKMAFCQRISWILLRN